MGDIKSWTLAYMIEDDQTHIYADVDHFTNGYDKPVCGTRMGHWQSINFASGRASESVTWCEDHITCGGCQRYWKKVTNSE